MTLFELLTYRMQASSGNQATFDLAFLSPSSSERGQRITVVTHWRFTPTVADLGEARALICTLPNFHYQGSTDNLRAAMHYQATGSVADPGMN